MQDYIRFNGVVVKQPDKYSAVLATTSTSDSDRDMALVMHNTPIGTVAGYDIEWSYLTAQEAAAILSQVLNRPSFTVHYYNILTASWEDGEFYASNFNAPAKILEEDEEYWEALSFNIRGINPV